MKGHGSSANAILSRLCLVKIGQDPSFNVLNAIVRYLYLYLSSLQRRGSGARGWRVACTVLLAIRFESRVELDDALRNISVKRQGEEDLFRNALTDKPADVLKPEAPVVLRMTHEAAPPGAKRLQTR